VLVDHVLVDNFKLNMYIHDVSRVLCFFNLAVSPYLCPCHIRVRILDNILKSYETLELEDEEGDY